jgi:chemotaxis protein MotA
MAVEFARKALRFEVRPTFEEVDRATQNLPSTT